MTCWFIDWLIDWLLSLCLKKLLPPLIRKFRLFIWKKKLSKKSYILSHLQLKLLAALKIYREKCGKFIEIITKGCRQSTEQITQLSAFDLIIRYLNGSDEGKRHLWWEVGEGWRVRVKIYRDSCQPTLD